MIKVIFFDIGGVYINLNHDKHTNFIANSLGIAPDDVKSVMDEFKQRFDTGEIPIEDYLRQVSEKLGISSESFEKIYTNEKDFEINDEMHKFILAIKANGYTVATITDTNPLHLRYHLEIGTYNVFDMVFDSVRFKSKKKDGKLFGVALKEINARPDECVIIDDTEEKLFAATKLGMNTVLFTGVDDLVSKLKKIGVKTNPY